VLNVLGVPGRTTNGKRQPFTGVLLCRLVAALCAAYPDPLSQDDLADAVWEHEPPGSWRSSLRVHIARLRTLLNETPGAPTLENSEAGYALIGELESFDFLVFRDLIKRSTVASSVAARYALLESALLLWDGSWTPDTDHGVLRTFLDRLEGARRAAERDRYRALIELGRFDEVIKDLHQHVLLDQHDEGLVEPLVAALLLSNRLGEAQNILNRALQVLHTSGLEAGVGLQSLQRQLLLKEVERTHPAASNRRKKSVEHTDNVMVGRTQLLTELLPFLLQENGLIVLEGEAGVGKSRFVQELGRSAMREDSSVLAASCTEHSPPGQVLKDLFAAVAPGLLLKELDPIESLWLCIEKLSEDSPALLVIEDLHFIDLLSAKLLRRFLLNRRPESLGIVVSIRPGPWSPFVRELAIDLLVSPGARHVVLKGLSQDAIDEWLEQSFMGRRSRRWELAGQLLRLSGGLPLLVDLLLKTEYLVEGEYSPTSFDSRLLPLIASLQTEMSEEQAEIVAVAALCGMESSTAIVAEVAECSAAQLFDAVDAAWRVGIMSKRSGLTVEFRHDLIRSAVVTQRLESWRCRVHRRIAEVMVIRNLDDGSICLHLANALFDETQSNSVVTLLDKVEDLQAIARWDISTRVLEICRENLESQPWLFSNASEFRLFSLLGRSYEGSHDTTKARESFRRAILVAGENLEMVAVAAVLSAGGSLPFDGDEERLRWLEIASQSNALPTRQRLTVMAELVKLQAMVELNQNILSLDEEVLALGAQFDDNHSRATIAYCHLVVMLSGPDAEGRLAITRSVDRTDPSLRPEVAMTALLVEMVSCLEIGAITDAQKLLIELEQMAARFQRPGEQWLVLVVRTVLSEWIGESVTALAEAQAALQLAERHEVRNAREVFSAFMLSRALKDGDWNHFLSLGSGPSSQSTNGLFVAAITLAVKTSLSSFASANDELQVLVDDLGCKPRFLGWLGAVILATEASLALGGQNICELITLLSPYSGKISVLGVAPAAVLGPVDFYIARLEFQRGNLAVAEKLAAEALLLASASGLASWTDRLTQLCEQIKDHV
jgi:DNA-binding SARP family transcriptional activator